MVKKSYLAMALSFMLPMVTYASPYIGLLTGVVVNTSDDAENVGEAAANYRGMPITIMGGYGADVGNAFYLGGEVLFTPSTGELSSSQGNDLKTTYGYGLSFIPGIRVSENVLGYARFGLLQTHYEEQGSNVSGAQFGVGLQASLTQHWDMRGEYNVTSYNNVKNISALRSDQFNIGVVYRFY